MMDLVIKAGFVAVGGGMCALAIRRYVPELSLVLSLATGGAVMIVMLSGIAQASEGLQALLRIASLDEELTQPVVKVTAIAIISRLMSQICRDAGEGTIALCCELAGTIGALAVTLPLMGKVVDLIGGLMG